MAEMQWTHIHTIVLVIGAVILNRLIHLIVESTYKKWTTLDGHYVKVADCRGLRSTCGEGLKDQLEEINIKLDSIENSVRRMKKGIYFVADNSSIDRGKLNELRDVLDD